MLKITLAAARVNAGFTQECAAKKLGVNNKTLGKWEKGETYPDVRMIPKICELYGIAYDALNFLPGNSL